MAPSLDLCVQNLPAMNFRHCPKICWTDYKREFVCLLAKCFRPDWRKFSEVYNTVFANDLRKEGFANGAPHGRIRGQWVDLKKKQNKTYQLVESCLSYNPEVAQKIHATCLRLNIKLIFREGMASSFQMALKRDLTETDHPSASSKRQKTACESFTSKISFSTTDNPEESTTRFQLSLSNSMPTSTSLPSSSSSIAPKFLFRAWSADSSGLNSQLQFVAGLWADEPISITEPPTDARILNLLSRVHLSRAEFKSPFISLTENPLDAVRRAMHHQPSFVSIFDTTKFSPHNFFSAQEILNGDPIIYGAKRQKYTGKNEWLIWGQIPTQAILATIMIDPMRSIPPSYNDIFQFDAIRKYHAYGRTLHSHLNTRNHRLTKNGGMLMGHLFKKINLPYAYAEELAITIAKKWHMKSRDDFAAFLEGVRAVVNPEVIHIQDNEWEDEYEGEGESEWEDIKVDAGA